MSDNPVPETLETIAAKIDALTDRFTRIDQQFADTQTQIGVVNNRFPGIDQQLAEMRAQLGVKIEALETKVMQVYDEVIAMREGSQRASEHKGFAKRLG